MKKFLIILAWMIWFKPDVYYLPLKNKIEQAHDIHPAIKAVDVTKWREYLEVETAFGKTYLIPWGSIAYIEEVKEEVKE